MTKQEATEKAKQPIKSSDPNAYKIGFERAEAVKSIVGNTYKSPNGMTIAVEKWVGQNYVIRINDDNYDAVPAIYFISKIDQMERVN